MKGFYSPIERLLEQSTRGKGTGAEFMTELSKQPGYKQAEVEDRDLQALMALPKMAREEFMAQLKAKPGVVPKERVFRGKVAPKDLTYEEEYERQNKGIDSEVHHEEHTLPGGENYREILLQHPKGNFPGVGAHFGGAPNVLASIRVKDRTGPNGEKILHLEEIQSDWHQQGREKGYAPKGVDLKEQARRAKFKHTMTSDQLKEAKERSASIDRDLASDAPLFQDPVVRERLAKAQIGYNDKIMDLMPEVMKAEEAHRAAEQQAKQAIPEAPFKKSWHELALKRMIQHAAENGYDQIHVTPGETQAERWGAKDKGGKGFYDLYDKQIPQFLNKFGKQYGVKVGQTPFVHKQDPKTAAEDDELLAQLGVDYPRDVKPVQMHSFPITPEMREDVKKNGIPMYAEGGEVGNKAKFVMDKSGKPLRVYHGTNQDIQAFSNARLGQNTKQRSAKAHFFTEHPQEAGEYASMAARTQVPNAVSHEKQIAKLQAQIAQAEKRQDWNTAERLYSQMENLDLGAIQAEPSGQNIMPVHLMADKVRTVDMKHGFDAERVADEIRKAKAAKMHALKLENVYDPVGDRPDTFSTNQWVVFDPKRIKSAIGNRGTYDPTEADITKAKGGVVSRETIKPVAHGIIKERVTVSPNLDAMQYELLSAKHFTKKVK